jgi:FAD/FMN-containing dehydrogenase
MHDPRAIISTGNLKNILDINIESRFAIVEPCVTMNDLVKNTLKHGLMPPVVPSFPGTTVGGSFAGTAGGSSSFRYGFFDRAVNWLEVVLPDGKIATASRRRNSDLLSAMVGTLGTIGIATLFQIKLIPAAQHVELTYLAVQSITEALDTIDIYSQDPGTDFVEGLVYGKEASSFGVIVVGKLSSTKVQQKQTFGNAHNPWFYQHALEAGCSTECVPILDYLFRYDRGSFCLGQYCFGQIPLNKWTRWLANSAMHAGELNSTAHSLHWAEHFIIQDLVIPLESTNDILNYLERDFGVYPLQLCPIRHWNDENTIMRPNPKYATMFIDVGVRGYTEDTIRDSAKFKEKNRDLEHVVHELGGMKLLYSMNYYTEDEFWGIYPRFEYETLRMKYNAQYLPSIYDKIKSSEKPRKTPKVEGFWNHVFARTSVLAQKCKNGNV